ncbi:MAG: carboxypeptidase regulatory-like domain-containing protein, partial [Desulfobacterales bacterium]|nr:carboxypeptidase regulatory-like domain-containing protein [Desulfobacterales bacterium]
VQIRNDNDDNRTYSNALVIDAIEWSAPVETLVAGRIIDAAARTGVAGAQIDITPEGGRITSGVGGFFTSTDIAPGTYKVEISAEGYYTKELSEVTISAGANYYMNTKLRPKAPEIGSAAADPISINNDGSASALLTAVATHPDGLDHILSVTVDLSGIGGAADQLMYDDGANGDAAPGDGTYSCRAEAATTAPIRGHILRITAEDDRGFTGFGFINLAVAARSLGVVQSDRSDSKTFYNPLHAQTLIISFTANRPGVKTAPGRNGDDCYVELTIYKPDGGVHGVYQVYDSLDVAIEGAEAGTWRFETENKCDDPVNYEIETQGGGTGMITGRVVDAYTGFGVSGADVSYDAGGGAQSLEDGYFAGVAVAGVGAVTTIAADYQVHIKTGEVIVAGGATNLTIQIIPEDAAALPAPTTENVSEVLDPSEDPDPLTQPFAAKISDGFLTLNALFPSYQQAMNLYLGLMVDYPGVVDALFLFDENNALTDASAAFPPWREGVTTEQSAQVLPPVPTGSLPPADYTFISMAAPASGAPAGFDLIYYSIPLGQAPPAGPVAAHIASPSETPDPAAQPLAARIVGDNLVLDVWFPPQQEAATIYVCYQGPGSSGAIQMLNVDDAWVELSDALTPWREEVKTKQSGTVLTRPLSEMTPGGYTFY